MLAALVAGGLLAHLGRGLTFFYDEWDWIFERREGGPEVFLRNHNGHLHLLPIVAYRVLFATVGLRTYAPYRALVIVVHLACAAAVFLYCRKRVAPPAALGVSVVVLFLGAAWQNLLWPFQIGFLGSVFFGVLALFFLDDEDGAGRRRDALVAVLVGLALVSSGIGVPVLLAVAAELVVRRSFRRLVTVVVPPLVAYCAWALVYGASQVDLANLSQAPRYVFDAAVGAAAGLGGLDVVFGRVIVVALGLAVLAFGVTRRLRPRVVALVVAAGSYWGLTALSRGAAGEPAASRYVYFGGIVLLLVAVELVRAWGSTVVVNAACLVVAAGLAFSSMTILRAGAAGMRDVSSNVRPELAAVELAGPRAMPDVVPDEQRMPQLTAGEYLEAVEDLGSPADDLARVRTRSAVERDAADRAFVRVLRRQPGRREGACERVDVATPVVVTAGPDGLALVAGDREIRLRLKRFGPGFADADPVPPAQAVRLLLTKDAAPEPWIAEVQSETPFEVCRPG